MSTHSGTLTRVIAIDALTHVLTRRIHVDVALQKLFATHSSQLRPLDRAFIYEIVLGSLRWILKMDWIMSHMMERPFSNLDPRVANALRVGTYQIYYMDRVPDRAAVSETVEATKQVGVANAASLVNAILRRVARKSEYFPKPDKVTHPVDYYSVQHSFPRWMIERWYKQIPTDKFEYLMVNTNKIPLITLKLIKRNSLPEGETSLATYLLRTQSIESIWRPLAGALQVQSLPNLEKCEAFRRGCYIIQDEAAQLVSSLVALQPDQTCLDACSSPGGKAIYLWDSGLSAERLTVCDISQKRIKLTLENFERVGLQGAEILHGNVLEKCEGRVFDKVVLDSPCSAMGVIRRHPEIKWLRTPGDIGKLALEQQKLIDGLAKNVAPGGELIYIVCSFEIEETTEQVDYFLTHHPEFEKVSPFSRMADFYKKYVRNDEIVIYSGNSDNLDGFFAVILRKK